MVMVRLFGMLDGLEPHDHTLGYDHDQSRTNQNSTAKKRYVSQPAGGCAIKGNVNCALPDTMQ